MKFPNLDVQRIVLYSTIIILVILVFYPLIWLFFSSFIEEGHVSLDSFASLITTSWYHKALVNSLIIATLTSIFATSIGLALAWLVTRTDMPFKASIEMLLILPFVSMPLLLGVSWTILLSPARGLINMFLETLFGPNTINFNIFTLEGLIWALGLYVYPYVFILACATFRSMDPSLEEAARICGSSAIGTLLRITFPLIAPAILSGFLLTFVSSMEQFGMPSVIGMPAGIYVFTTAIYVEFKTFPPDWGAGTALSTVLLLITMILVYSQRRIIGRKSYATITGKGARPNIVRLGRYKKYLALTFCIFFLLFAVFLPYFAIISASFFPSLYYLFDWSKITLENYVYIIFEHPGAMRALRNSLILGAGSAVLTTLLGVLVSYIIVRTSMRGRKWLDFLSMLPFAIPGMVLAAGMLWAYIRPPLVLYGTLWILLVAYVTRLIPNSVRSCSSALMQIHKELEESSRICGASWTRSLYDIMLPLIKNGMVASAFLVFMPAMRELSASILLYSFRSETTAVIMYELLEEGVVFGPTVAFMTLVGVSSTLILFIIYMIAKVRVGVR